jgi:hypothetical protein
MEWQNVYDPKYEIEFIPGWYTGLSNTFFPDDIQNMINQKGVIGMVQDVNRHFVQSMNQHVLLLTHVDGHRVLKRAQTEMSAQIRECPNCKVPLVNNSCPLCVKYFPPPTQPMVIPIPNQNK